MALPTVSRTWQYRVNQILAAGTDNIDTTRLLLFAVIQSMLGLGSGWTNNMNVGITPVAIATVIGSSDGVTAGMDAVNRITDRTKLIYASGTNAHAWIVLGFASIGVQVLLSCNFVSSSFELINITVSHSGFGTANGGTNGSTTVDPTALNSVPCIAASTWGAPVSAVPSALHVMTSADGESFRLIVCRNNKVTGRWHLTKASSAQSGWAHPYYAYFLGSSTTVPTTDTDVNLSNFGTAGAGKGYGSTAAIVIGLTTEAFVNSSATLISSFVAPNPYSLEWYLFGIGLASITINNVGRLGLVADLWMGLSNVVTGAMYPASTDPDPRQFAVFGALTYPWNRTVAVTTA